MRQTLYTTCPKCAAPTERDANNKITCTKCSYSWFPLDLALQDMALQVTDLTKCILQMQTVIDEILNATNENTKAIEYYRRIVDNIIKKMETKP